VIAIAVPLWFLTPTLIRQAFDTYTFLQKTNFADFFSKFPTIFTPEVSGVAAANVQSFIGKTFTSFLNYFSDFLVNFPNLLLQFAVFIFVFFFATRDSEKLTDYFSKLSPFSASTEVKIMSEFRGITNAIVYGQILIGILQGLLIGIGLFIIGVPRASLLTFIAVIVSIIPMLGSWIVWLPVGIFLLASGQTSSGTFLLIYGLLFVSTIDNILRPLFLSKRSHLNIVLSVIGTVGGLYYFGIVGLILGPLILAYILIIFDLYRQGKLSELFKK
jgi:predicted PurR-regulated permease PerM